MKNNKHTYCPDLWEMFTLDNKGNIFHCNHIKPEKIGNIYKDKLLTLLNNPISLKYRKLSLEGKLPCYKDCNWVNKSINPKDISTEINITTKNLKRIHLHWGLPCNISCIMCKQRRRLKTNKEILSSDIIIKNIDIKYFDDVYLSGGEPLYIDECLKYMEYLETINKKYIILTNGLLINDKMAYRLAKYAKKVIISINAATKKTHEIVNRGSNFERLLNNIYNLKLYRDKLNTNLEIIGRMTITVPALSEIPEFILKYKELGFDKINFGYDKETVIPFLSDNSLFKKDLAKKINEALKQSNLKEIDTSRLKILKLK